MENNTKLRDVLDALKEADRVGAVDDARKLAQVADRLTKAQPELSWRQAQPEPELSWVQGQPEPAPQSYLAKGVAGALGAPVDITSAILRKVGVIRPKAPPSFGGSKSIEEGFRKVGFNVPKRPPETTSEYIGQGIGEAMGMFVPGMGVVKHLKEGTGLAASIAKGIWATMKRHPWATATSELAGGAGAGFGRKVGKEHPGAGPIPELIGGLAGGMAPGIVRTVPTPTRLVFKGGKWAWRKVSYPFSKAGVRQRAGEFLKKQVANPATSAAAAVEKSIGELPPVAMTGEKRLMALYKGITKLDPIKDAKVIEQVSNAAFKLKNEIKALGEGSPEILQFMVEKRIASLELAMDNRVLKALNAAQKKLNALPIARRQSQESIIVRDELTKVMRQENKNVQDVWKVVPKQIKVGVGNTKKIATDILEDLPTAQQGDFPAVLRNHSILKKDVTSTTIKEMQGLRAKLLEIGRQAKSLHKFNKHRITKKVSNAMLQDMTVTASNNLKTPEGKLLDIALSATRQFKHRFEEGTVGKILGYSKTSAPTISPELTLDIATSKKGVVDINKIVVTPEARAATKRYMARSFTDYSLDKNEILVPHKARRWIRNNEEILDSFPNFRSQLEDISQAQDLALSTKATMEVRKARLRDPRISVASRFLRADVGDEVKRILKAHNPVKDTNQLVRMARKDTTGKAMDGLRGGFIEHILDTSSIGDFNSFGERTLSGNEMLGFMNKNKNVLRQVFKPEQISRMKKIGGELSKLEILAKTEGAKIVYNDIISNFIDRAAGVVGAAVGRWGGRFTKMGGTIQGPGYTAQFFRKIINLLTNNSFEQLVSDAITEPDGKLLEALLLPINKPETLTGMKNIKTLEIRMHAWLLGTGSRVMRDIAEEESENEQRVNSGGE